MAKGRHFKRTRKFRKYLRGGIDETKALGVLAAGDLLKEDVADAVSEKAWCSSVNLSWSLANFTPTAKAGPILVGIAHSDYTDAEIEAWIENLFSWNQGDQVQQEVASRKIRRVGILIPAGTGLLLSSTLNDGRPLRTKAGWQLVTGQTIALWYYNMGSVDLVTGAEVETIGFANLWPN